MTMLTTALIQGLENSGTPDPMIEGLKKHLTKIADAMVNYRREVSLVSGDGDFTKGGKKKRIMEIAQATADKLRGIENSAHGYDDHIAQTQRSFKPDKRPDDTTLSFLQEQEVRQRLADLDVLELQIKYMDACGDGGPGSDLIAAACESDPMPRLSEEVLQEGIILRGQRKSPEEAKKLADLIRIRAAFKDALQEARGELQKDGLPGDDFLMRIARGELEET